MSNSLRSQPNPSDLLPYLPKPAICRLITLHLAELGTDATEDEIWDGVDPGKALAWDVRRDVLARLLADGRLEKVEARDCRFINAWREVYRLITATTPKQGRLF